MATAGDKAVMELKQSVIDKVVDQWQPRLRPFVPTHSTLMFEQLLY